MLHCKSGPVPFLSPEHGRLQQDQSWGASPIVCVCVGCQPVVFSKFVMLTYIDISPGPNPQSVAAVTGLQSFRKGSICHEALYALCLTDWNCMVFRQMDTLCI